MNNEPVAWMDGEGGFYHNDDYEVCKEHNIADDLIPLYTHPVNPYQSITNTKIEPTVVSYTHPVKEMSETRIKQIFVEQTGFYFDDNPADDLALMDFAKALLLEAQD